MERAEQIILKSLGNPLSIKLRQSIRARNVAIRIKGKEVELVLPKNVNKNKALEFLLKKEVWIRSKLVSTEQVANDKVGLFTRIPILGDDFNVKYINCSNKLHVQKESSNITVSSPKSLYTKVLTEYMKQYSLAEIKRLVRLMSKKYHLTKYNKIAVKEVTSRWGSCSSNGNLSFNWRIIFAPQSVFYYVVAHEMSHLKEMNHSKKFWALVSKIAPDYQSSIRWLKKYGTTLYQYCSK